MKREKNSFFSSEREYQRLVITTSLIIQAVLPIYALILIGCLLRKTKALNPEADHSLMKIVINCLYPCLIIDKMVKSEAVRDVALTAWTIPIAFLIIVVGLFTALLVAKLFSLKRGSSQNTFALSSGVQNYGYTAVPIIMELFSEDLLGVLFVHSLGVEVAIWTLGISVLSGGGMKNWKACLNGPVIAVLVGLVLVYTGAGDRLATAAEYEWVMNLINWVGACAFPLGLMLVGATLIDNLKGLRFDWRVCSAAILTRFIISPIFILALAVLLPIPKELKTVLVVQAAMPSAVMPIVLAKLYGGVPKVAVQVVIITQVIGLLSIPLWMKLGLSVALH